MSPDEPLRIGFLIGREKDLPDAVMARVNEDHEDVRAELIKIGGTYPDEPVPYAVIVDRMSHEIPYYRTFVCFAGLQGCYIINNPFVWANDTKFLSAALLDKLGIKTPRTVVLPNKDVLTDTVPDSFRNLNYPMDWQGIVDQIGSPAIFKDVRSGGRRFAHRVSGVDELIQRYDESGTRTMILQQVIESNEHVHCLVMEGDRCLLLAYKPDEARYGSLTFDPNSARAQAVVEAARKLTHIYGYDMNLVEFVLTDEDTYLINATNPSPMVNREMMTAEQFDWIVNELARLVVSRARKPVAQWMPLNLDAD